MPFRDATPAEIDDVMEASHAAFLEYRKLSFRERAAFMRTVAAAIEKASEELIALGAGETNLSAARLKTEITRTIFQWTSYADACEKGDWLNCRIDTADRNRNPPKPDLRKTMLPLGPVIVFGASNFPFAYSTGGGDTASAFAAGCTVVVKGHPAHVQTSLRMAEIISIAVKECGFPDDIFQHVHGSSFDTGKMLVRHGRTKAVGFTGSVSGGTALFQWANQREIPIPVFAEMGSVNPVFIFPQKLLADSASVAKMIASSITLGLGQFCTKPGLIFLLNNDHSKNFISILANEVGKVPPGKMLHEGIATSYKQKSAAGMGQPGVEVIYSGGSSEGSAAIASVTAKTFLNNPLLHEEVFGPFSLVVKCESVDEMNVAAKKLHGQLTATVIASDQEINDHGDLLVSLKDVCGRMIFNGVPTGVEVALSMHHGGPFPATTDSRFTAVGADAIRRFARPICFQNCPGDILPDELKNENPLGFWRTINNELTRDPVD